LIFSCHKLPFLAQPPQLPDGAARGVASIQVDGKMLSASMPAAPLTDDGNIHQVRMVLG
jgi:hypothetical protein